MIGIQQLFALSKQLKKPSRRCYSILEATYRGHSLLELSKIIERELGLDMSEVLDDLRELTIHNTISRYPNAANALPYELYTEEKARELIERAEKVIEWVKRYLP